MASILLVDDAPDILELGGAILEMHGHQVRACRDGVEALHALDAAFPQLVVTDVQMPMLDGPAMVMRMFVENLGRENIPVVLMSAGLSVAHVARTVGTPYFLPKPFSVDGLIEMVDRALREAVPPRPPVLTS